MRKILFSLDNSFKTAILHHSHNIFQTNHGKDILVYSWYIHDLGKVFVGYTCNIIFNLQLNWSCYGVHGRACNTRIISHKASRKTCPKQQKMTKNNKFCSSFQCQIASSSDLVDGNKISSF